MPRRRITLTRASSEDLRHATVAARAGLEEVVCFPPVKVVQELPIPWPRYQEMVGALGDSRRVPTQNDLVLAVSHAWSHQLHPDPLGKKAEQIKKLTAEALKDHQIKGEPMLFYDFMSMSQNPFEAGQTERTPEEQAAFLRAIGALPEVFFTADAVLHVEGDWPELEVEKTTHRVSWSQIAMMNFRQNGSRVIAHETVPAKDGTTAQLPVFTLRSDPSGLSKITSVSELHAVRNRRRGSACLSIRHLFHRDQPSAKPAVDPVFLVQPSPMGRRNAVPAGERGWIYFERLVSTIRVALTDEQYAARTVYANVPELKESILARARHLRQAATTSNKDLQEVMEEYIAEIRKKTFSATSIDKKNASAKAKVTDEDLVFDLLTSLRERVSLALALTVRNLSVEDCSFLLNLKADLTIQDGRGYSPLHNATRWRNVEVVKLLLEKGAAAGQRDRQGSTPAHVIPLYADEITLELLLQLAPDVRYLRKANRAGLRVFDRMEVWAMTAVKGGPYQPVLDWLSQMKSENPDLAESEESSRRKRKHGRFRVKSTTITVNLGPETRFVRKIEPKFQAVGRILYLGMPRFIPWSLQEPILESWAAAEGFEIWALNEDSVIPRLLSEGPDAFRKDLSSLVQALLPELGPKFILVDSSFGLGTFLAWELRPFLEALLIINVHLFNAPDFEQTEMAQKICKRMAYLGETYGKQDYEAILTLLPDFMYPTGGPAGVEETKQAYKLALESASPNFWEMAMLQPSYNFEHLTGVFTSMPPWPVESPPVLLATSDQAPLVVVGEAMQRLQQIMPGSKLEFIPNSKWSWHLEGVDVIDEVSGMLTSLVASKVASKVMTKHVHVNGTERPVVVIEPTSPAIENILYLGCPRFIPFSLQQPILEEWVQTEFVKIWALNEDSVIPRLLSEGPDAFRKDLSSLVQALLPELGPKFILVDSSFGLGTFLAWELRPFLEALLIINVHLFNAPDFEQTEMAQKICKRMAYLGETYGKQDYEAILTLLPDFMYPTGGPAGVEETKQAYKLALESASPNFWEMAMLQPSYNFEHLTGVFTSMPPWPVESPPVLLATSDQAPLVVVGEAMQRLQQIMPGSKLEFIPNSKWSWHLEGADVVESVSGMISSLLPLENESEERVCIEIQVEDVPLLAFGGAVPVISMEACGPTCEDQPCCKTKQPCKAFGEVCPVQ